MTDSQTLSPAPTPGRAAWIYAALAIALCGVALLLALKFWLPNWILQEVERQALARGIQLQGCSLAYERGRGIDIHSIELTQCKIRLERPFAAQGTIERLQIQLQNNAPTSVFVSGAAVDVQGDLDWSAVKDQFSGVSKESFDILGQDNRVAWLSEPDLPATIVATQIQRLTPKDPWSATLAMTDLIEGTAIVSEQLSLRLNLKAQPNTYVSILIDPSHLMAEVKGQFEGLPVALLSGLLFQNVPPELMAALLDGRVELSLPFGLNPKQPQGKFDLTLHGVNFPVPRELAGLVHDRAPQLSGEMTSNRAYTDFEVPKLRFETGTLRMTGKARIHREDLATRWSATMQGPLSCAAIVASAAKVHLSTELARAARTISNKALQGSVNVFVALEADSRDLASAKLVKTVGVGCGLKPMALSDWASLPVELLKDFPELSELKIPGLKAGELPTLPKVELPSMGKLPKVEIPKLELPKFGPKEPSQLSEQR